MILLYIGLIIIGLLFAYLRPGIKLLQGKKFLRFNFIYILIEVVVNRFELSIIEISFLILLGVASLLMRNIWLLLRYDAVQLNEILRATASLVMAPIAAQGLRFIITIAGQPATINTRPLIPSTCFLTFSGAWSHNKGEVIRRLLVKKFQPTLPRIVIKIGGINDKNI